MSLKNSSDTMGNRIRDLPACRAVAQPTAPRVPHTQRIGFLKDDEAHSNFSQFFERVYKLPRRHAVKCCEAIRRWN